VAGYLNAHASIVAAIWFVVFSARLIRLLASFGYTQRIRNYKTHPVDEFWIKRINHLAGKLQISRRIALLESEIVSVPVMTGIFKPMILLPISLVTQLKPDEVEAILLHELAHIRRKDYFVNMLQHFAEIIFFFNPGVLWLSSLIRDEREHCCDDLAIQETRSKEKFIRALVVFQEYHLRDTRLALGFPGQKNHLLGRVKRIITNKNKSLNNMEKIVMIAGIVIFGFFAVTFSQQNPSFPKSSTESKIGPSAEIPETAMDISDTVPKQKSIQSDIKQVTTGTTKEGKSCKIVEVNGKMTELYIDGKKIPKEKWPDYQPLRIDIKVRMDAEKQKMKAEQDALKYEQDVRVQEQKLATMHAEELKKEIMEKMSMDKIDQEKLARQLVDMKVKQEVEANLAYSELAEKKVELAKRMAEMKEIQMAKEVEMSRELAEEDAKQAVELKAALGQMNAIPASPMRLNKPIMAVIMDLKSAGTINDDENLSFSLNNNELIVNGKKQPAELHEQLKSKYLKSPKDHINYSSTKNSSSAEVVLE
jgi:beta-lactamase regulating signal transducer with metallopeptidase domain